MAIQSFRDLKAWQEGHRLVLLTYKLTKLFPKEELFGITNQMRRAVVSITSNIAEGFSRNTVKDKIQFYAIALGSLTEIHNQFIISGDLNYINKEDFSKVEEKIITLHKIINGLIKGCKNFRPFA
ncbi:MAG: four helix bundle protein [Candidatus Berkelbacteria bacterium]|nr:four helix bundle protein [Candidatus Berkelbacteria bacterium]